MKNENPLLCDLETGVCLNLNVNESGSKLELNENKLLRVVYYTDPICSSCWAIEPQLKKLKLEYGHIIEVEYYMGGLLPDWSYNSGGISKPSDVALHWDEASKYYDMPIDGDVWLENPLASSYPISIAFKAAQIQNKNLAIIFLRKIREMLFLEKKNINHWKYIQEAALSSNLDVERLKKDFDGVANGLFENDLATAKKMGVKGFPSFFFINQDNHIKFIYGARPYKDFEEVVTSFLPDIQKNSYGKSYQELFSKYSSLTIREFSELSDLQRDKSEELLESLYNKNELYKKVCKNGVLYFIKN